MIIGIFKDVETSDTSAVRPDTLRQSDGVTDGGTDTVEATSPRESTVIGWAYVGSHNFTLSAWGILSGPSSNPTLTVRTLSKLHPSPRSRTHITKKSFIRCFGL